MAKSKTAAHVPVKEGDRVTLQVEGLNHQGEGVARSDGFTIFVPAGLPGDIVNARVISRKKTYARALVEELLQPSSNRVSPPCLHHDLCGGCQLQHLAYEQQLAHKKMIVEDALLRLGGLNIPVLPVIGMDEPWGYRNKAQVPVALDGETLRAGFYQARSHSIVDLEECPVQHPANTETLLAARRAVKEAGVEAYDESRHRGDLRHLVIRTAPSTGETLIILVTTGHEFPGKEKLVQALIRQGIKSLMGIVQNINPRRGNVILGREDITLWGRGYLEEKLGGLVFRISPQSFFQVNSFQAEVLLAQIRKLAGLSGEETVFDLYCGTGAIALYLSRYARRVVGVESVEQAVKDARQNARLNGINNTEFFLGRAEDVAPMLVKEGYTAHLVVVDPPRGGCQPELLKTMENLAPSRIIYVSCNPASLARDLKLLTQAGYEGKVAQPVDMFPHTSHVECVLLMSRMNK